jgi:lysophospholipase L1-like esterase
VKKLLSRLLVICLTIAFTLGLLEIGVRIFWNKISGQVIPLSLKTHRPSANKKLGYELIPESFSFEDNTWYRINKDGIRDEDYARIKPANTYRIAAVGDSCTFGMAVDLKDTWPKQLEKELQRSRANVEVINFGVMGYNTTQEAEIIREKVLGYSPDLIVIGYSLNDIGILSRERTALSTYRGYNSFMTTGIGFIDSILGRSKLYLLLKNRFYLKKTKADTKPPRYSKDGQKVLKLGYNGFLFNAYQEPENWSRLQTAFADIRRATQPQVPVLIAIYPELQTLQQYPFSHLHEIVRKLAGQNGFAVVDPLSAFLPYKVQDVRISTANAHPNQLGNKIFSQAIAIYLQGNALSR